MYKLGETPFRKNYAGIGYKYDEFRDAFIPPKPFTSWVFNEKSCSWDPSVPRPESTEDEIYEWNESLYASGNTEGWVLLEV